MLFNSLQYLVFLPVAVTGYFLLPFRFRWAWLLALSCWFYMAFVPAYILILGFTIVIDYAAGILIASATGQARKAFLLASIAANVGVLALYKYFDFLSGNVGILFKLIDWKYPIPALGLVLPIGLSFHTFQAMSYTIEVYRGAQKPERHFGIYALYVMFFPQLVAGPIERPQNLLTQFRVEHFFDYTRVTDGLKRITWGMFKKVAIADRLSPFVNQVYDAPRDHAGCTLLIATVFFAFQIYCDFSGYSDIAIGSAEVLGFRLMENFRRPYFSQSIAEFWSRWHISLSSWFRDYVYIPLGGKWQRTRNVMIVFLLSGLWHGASWTFVIWGALNGVFVLAGQWLPAFPMRWARILITFALTCFAWIFFRAKNLDDALYIATHLFGGTARAIDTLTAFGRANILIMMILIAAMELIHLLQERGRLRSIIARQPVWVRWPAYYAATMLILLFGVFDGPQAFIYFQF